MTNEQPRPRLRIYSVVLWRRIVWHFSSILRTPCPEVQSHDVTSRAPGSIFGCKAPRTRPSTTITGGATRTCALSAALDDSCRCLSDILLCSFYLMSKALVIREITVVTSLVQSPSPKP